MEDINSPVFAQAKIEYTKQLIDVLKLPLYEGLQKIYNDMSKLELNIDSMKNNINKLEADMKYVVEFLLKKHGNAAAVPIETSHAPYR